MRQSYYLEFDDRSGTDRKRFATFRLNLSWAKRLRVGSVVFLCDTKTKQVYGKAKVLRIETGKASAILETWGTDSHLERYWLGEVSAFTTFEFDKIMVEAKDRRWASMLKRYGPAKFNENTNLTMLLLTRHS